MSNVKIQMPSEGFQSLLTDTLQTGFRLKRSRLAQPPFVIWILLFGIFMNAVFRLAEIAHYTKLHAIALHANGLEVNRPFGL
jgi:hypothetical protein